MDSKTIEKTFVSNNKKSRITNKIEELLNNHIYLELEASQIYLSFAAWAEYKGYEGLSIFMYKQADEERLHMLKIYKYMLDRDCMPQTPKIESQSCDCSDLKDVLEKTLKHESLVTASYEKSLPISLKLGDNMTYEFLQWFINEQREEEATILNILDKLEIAGNDKLAMYFIDKELKQL